MANSSDPARVDDVSSLPGVTTLFADYLAGHSQITHRFATRFRTEADWQAAVDRVHGRQLERGALADVLLDQNRAWEMPSAVIDNVERLRQPDAVAVVTGQQLGIFGGPLFTLYKTITAIRLAGAMEEQLGVPVVPVFWVEGEDHDFAEISVVHLLRQNDVVDVRLKPPEPPSTWGAVGRIVLGEDVVRSIDEVDEALAPSDFHDDVIALLRDAYKPGRTLEDAFVVLWKAFFGKHGLVFMNPDDRRFKRMVSPLFERDLTDGQEVVDAVMSAGAALRPRYHRQVTARPTNLFYLEDTGRYAIDLSDGVYRLRGTDRTFSREQILTELASQPEFFSPNVVTRPLMQDVILPTAYYVAGPGEIAYFAQYAEAYDWAGIPMPGIYPRMSATLVEPKVRKVLERQDADLTELAAGVETVFSNRVRQVSGNGAAGAFEQFRKEVHAGLERLKPEVDGIDRTLVRSVEATRAGMIKEIDRLEERVFRAQKRQHDELRGQIEKAAVNLFPEGRLQERVLSPLYYLNKFGPSLIDRLFDELSLDTTGHQLIEL
jgi:bacillithiol synthase